MTAQNTRELLREFYTQIVTFAPSAVSGLLIFFGFWVASLVIEFIVVKAFKQKALRRPIIKLLGQTAKISVLVFGFVTALGTMGVNVGALIAGLGLSSFALGFALKDALSNTMAGISILLYRPFKLGDKIAITGFEGVVVDIDLRYTTLDSGERKILVPNSNVFINPVIVFTQVK